MTAEEAMRRGHDAGAQATAELLASEAAEALEPHVHPEPYLTEPVRLPDGSYGEPRWTSRPARWPGRGLRLEIGDRAYLCLILEARNRP